MIRQMIDMYLDGAATPLERAELERTLAQDGKAAQLFEQIKAERALRAAVYASYQPGAEESRMLSARVIQMLHEDAARPIATIGIWTRRISAVAAVLVLAAGCFVIGRATAPTHHSNETAQAQVIYRVLYVAETGDTEMREFASIDDANTFMKQMDVRHADPVVVADGPTDANFDADHPGSF
jgi:anti-sigma factor RsiW